MIQGVDALRSNNLSIITQMQSSLDEEEASDSQLRNTYGSKWNRMPSNSLNMQFRQTLGEYQAKVQQAASTDEQITLKFQSNTDALQLLSKCKSDLCNMIPQSQDTAALVNNPTVVA